MLQKFTQLRSHAGVDLVRDGLRESFGYVLGKYPLTTRKAFGMLWVSIWEPTMALIFEFAA